MYKILTDIMSPPIRGHDSILNLDLLQKVLKLVQDNIDDYFSDFYTEVLENK